MLEKNNEGVVDVEKVDVEAEMVKEVEIDRKEIMLQLKGKSYDLMGKIERLNGNVNSYIKEILKDNVDYLKIQIAQNEFKEISKEIEKLDKV